MKDKNWTTEKPGNTSNLFPFIEPHTFSFPSISREGRFSSPLLPTSQTGSDIKTLLSGKQTSCGQGVSWGIPLQLPEEKQMKVKSQTKPATMLSSLETKQENDTTEKGSFIQSHERLPVWERLYLEAGMRAQRQIATRDRLTLESKVLAGGDSGPLISQNEWNAKWKRMMEKYNRVIDGRARLHTHLEYQQYLEEKKECTFKPRRFTTVSMTEDDSDFFLKTLMDLSHRQKRCKQKLERCDEEELLLDEHTKTSFVKRLQQQQYHHSVTNNLSFDSSGTAAEDLLETLRQESQTHYTALMERRLNLLHEATVIHNSHYQWLHLHGVDKSDIVEFDEDWVNTLRKSQWFQLGIKCFPSLKSSATFSANIRAQLDTTLFDHQERHPSLQESHQNQPDLFSDISISQWTKQNDHEIKQLESDNKLMHQSTASTSRDDDSSHHEIYVDGNELLSDSLHHPVSSHTGRSFGTSQIIHSDKLTMNKDQVHRKEKKMIQRSSSQTRDVNKQKQMAMKEKRSNSVVKCNKQKLNGSSYSNETRMKTRKSMPSHQTYQPFVQTDTEMYKSTDKVLKHPDPSNEIKQHFYNKEMTNKRMNQKTNNTLENPLSNITTDDNNSLIRAVYPNNTTKHKQKPNTNLSNNHMPYIHKAHPQISHTSNSSIFIPETYSQHFQKLTQVDPQRNLLGNTTPSTIFSNWKRKELEPLHTAAVQSTDDGFWSGIIKKLMF